MRYAAVDGGKRLRPLLCINATETLGGNTRKALPSACSVELVHCYSLVHDDLPSMDNDDLRRGKPSCHAKFGEATAILAGTSLLTLAFAMVAGHGEPAISTLARAAGHEGMNQGQMLDLQMSGGGASAARIHRMHELKTGRLISASLQLGALAAGATPRALKAMELLGNALGKLYQLVDDIIDDAGGELATGKTPGKDRSQKKPSAVVALGLDKSLKLAVKAHEEVLRIMRSSGNDRSHLPGIVNAIVAPLSAIAGQRA